MKEFLENVPVNYWLSIVLIVVEFMAFIYVVYFYRSKQGKDERGRLVFAKASMITFCVTLLIFLIFTLEPSMFLTNERGAMFLILLGSSSVCICQSLSIIILNKFT